MKALGKLGRNIVGLERKKGISGKIVEGLKAELHFVFLPVYMIYCFSEVISFCVYQLEHSLCSPLFCGGMVLFFSLFPSSFDSVNGLPLTIPLHLFLQIIL